MRIIHSVAEALEMSHEQEVEKHHAEMQRMGEVRARSMGICFPT